MKKRISDREKILWMRELVVNSISTAGNCEQALRTFKKRFPRLTKPAVTTYMDDALDLIKHESRKRFLKTRSRPTALQQ